MAFALGVDFGTSHTVATVVFPGGRSETLLFDSSPLLASGVYADNGRLLVGRDGERAARMNPAPYEPNPKRRIDDGVLLLGSAEVPVVEAVGAVLDRVHQEARRVLGASPSTVVLTHPAAWAQPRQSLLAAAALSAGLGEVILIAEPVAAAGYFTTVLGHEVPAGHAVVVYDLGAGTFDISVVRRGADGGWDVVAAAGLDDVGGLDFDEAIVTRVGTLVGDTEQWRRMAAPSTTADYRARRQLWEDARTVKEQLTRGSSAGMPVPLLERDIHVTREEFEALARPHLDRTVALTTATLFTSGVTADRLAGVFLVGGSSRIPMVATLIHRALGVAPVVIEQPELVVAHGSVHGLTASESSPPDVLPGAARQAFVPAAGHAPQPGRAATASTAADRFTPAPALATVSPALAGTDQGAPGTQSSGTAASGMAGEPSAATHPVPETAAPVAPGRSRSMSPGRLARVLRTFGASRSGQAVGLLVLGLVLLGVASGSAYWSGFSGVALAVAAAGGVLSLLGVRSVAIRLRDRMPRRRWLVVSSAVAAVVATALTAATVNRAYATQVDECLTGNWTATAEDIGAWESSGVKLSIRGENGTYGDGSELSYRATDSDVSDMTKNPYQTFRFRAYDGKFFFLQADGVGMFAAGYCTSWTLFSDGNCGASYTCDTTTLVWTGADSTGYQATFRRT
ncbi:Hsp70 family protein [Dactylosporangium cerinum]|uniref:Hsp70 family protein n=1 Tax=Dactylosporangium cerinum TaxID=1434730 RepID=A0ABV9WEM8_9ACTN